MCLWHFEITRETRASGLLHQNARSRNSTNLRKPQRYQIQHSPNAGRVQTQQPVGKVSFSNKSAYSKGKHLNIFGAYRVSFASSSLEQSVLQLQVVVAFVFVVCCRGGILTSNSPVLRLMPAMCIEGDVGYTLAVLSSLFQQPESFLSAWIERMDIIHLNHH